MQASNRLIKLPETSAKTGLSRSNIYALISKDQFPKQIKLSERSMAFVEKEIDDWIAGRIAASRVGA